MENLDKKTTEPNSETNQVKIDSTAVPTEDQQENVDESKSKAFATDQKAEEIADFEDCVANNRLALLPFDIVVTNIHSGPLKNIELLDFNNEFKGLVRFSNTYQNRRGYDLMLRTLASYSPNTGFKTGLFRVIFDGKKGVPEIAYQRLEMTGREIRVPLPKGISAYQFQDGIADKHFNVTLNCESSLILEKLDVNETVTIRIFPKDEETI